MNLSYNGKSIAKNTIYNLLGYGIPLVFAIIFIPLLIKGLGTEKFGILSLAWGIIGYLSFFDFGIGRALTKIISEKIGANETETIPDLFWTSLFLMLLISSVISFILIFLVPTIVFKFLNIPKVLQSETQNTFYILAASIPLVTTTAGLRGVLEAYQKFAIINAIRTFLGVSSFLVPLLTLFFTHSLFWIVLFLIFIRILVWALYFLHCFKLNNTLVLWVKFNFNLVKQILMLSSWMTITNIIVPLIIYLDRFLIGALVSVAAIAFYITPYEVISRMLIIPSALTGVLFPTFSSIYLNNVDFVKKISLKSIKYIFLILYPAVLILVLFSHELLSIWLDNTFAANSSIILRLFAIGILFNSIAYIPFTFLQGIGRPDITAKVQIIELPFYVLTMWFATLYGGINCAAFVWLIRMIVDAVILLLIAKKILILKYNFKWKYIYISLSISAPFLLILVRDIGLKIILILLVLLLFLYLVWKQYLQEDEKYFLKSRINVFLNKIRL